MIYKIICCICESLYKWQNNRYIRKCYKKDYKKIKFKGEK